jgi:type IV secretory pathway TrbL component
VYGLNEAFYNVTDKLIEIQAFFMSQAWGIGRVALLIAICTAGLNYALTGTGLKENIIKILKATVFFFVVMGAYPRIVSWITEYTYNAAYNSTYVSMAGFINSTTSEVRAKAEKLKAEDKQRATYGDMAVTSDPNYFGEIIVHKTYTAPNGKTFRYSAVAPAGALQAILMVAGECLRFADDPPKQNLIPSPVPDFGAIFKGLLCAFFVMFTGIFALLEYLVAFLEFIFISSVGIILFPLSLWDGSKFMAEKFISALLGFFIKLLFCTICIFLMMYGFLALAHGYVKNPFMGLADQIIMIMFTCLLFFFICKSAPGLAQSLLTGAPSLNAAGAIGAAASAVGAVASVAGLGAQAGLNLAAGGAKALGAAKETAGAVKGAGGGGLTQAAAGAGAFMASIGHSGVDTAKSVGTSLTRSLLSKSPLAGHAGSGGSGATNRFSATQRFMEATKDGKTKSLGEFMKEEKAGGAEFANKAFKLNSQEPSALENLNKQAGLSAQSMMDAQTKELEPPSPPSQQ